MCARRVKVTRTSSLTMTRRVPKMVDPLDILIQKVSQLVDAANGLIREQQIARKAPCGAKLPGDMGVKCHLPMGHEEVAYSRTDYDPRIHCGRLGKDTFSWRSVEP